MKTSNYRTLAVIARPARNQARMIRTKKT